MYHGQAPAQRQMKDGSAKQERSVEQATAEEAVAKKLAPRLLKALLHELRVPRAHVVLFEERYSASHHQYECNKAGKRSMQVPVGLEGDVETQERRQGERNNADARYCMNKMFLKAPKKNT